MKWIVTRPPMNSVKKIQAVLMAIGVAVSDIAVSWRLSKTIGL